MKKNAHQTFKERCDEMGDTLYDQYYVEENSEGSNSEGCGDQMFEWVKARFWGRLVEDNMKIFHQVWKILDEKGNIGKKHEYVYGDIDVGLWIEKVKNPLDKKVIASTRYCSMADDNTHLYIMSGLEYIKEFPSFLNYKCRTVWPRASYRGGYKVAVSEEYPDGWLRWGDDRDVKVPSINTYRSRDFNFSYGDCRDKGHVFTYEFGACDNPHWNESRISYALRDLRWHLDALKDYEENRCL